MSAIRITGQLRLVEENLASFRKFVGLVKAIVEEKEQGRSLAYDYYISDHDPLQCMIHEVYADEVAFATHMGNIAEVSAANTGLFSVEAVQICGRLSSERREWITEHYGDVFKFFSEKA
jgi:quinol monooxygenase YgiN